MRSFRITNFKSGLIEKARQFHTVPPRDLLHHLRVLKTVEHICRVGGDPEVYIPTALFHDEGFDRIGEVCDLIRGCHPYYLKEQKLNRIAHCITGQRLPHEERARLPFEGQAVADAERLEGTGLIGIITALHRGALMHPKRMLHHPSDPLHRTSRVLEPESYTFDRIFRQLEKAELRLITGEGRKIFEKRRYSSEQFFNNFQESISIKKSLRLPTEQKKLREALIEFARPLYIEHQFNDPAHDFPHILRVLHHCEEDYVRMPEPKPNLKVLWVAALCHDSALIPKNHTDAPKAAEMSAKIAIQMLEINRYNGKKLISHFSKEELDSICVCIVNHSWSHGSSDTSKLPIEARMLQAADASDNTGAWAYIRTFTVGGLLLRDLYSEKDPHCLERAPDRIVASLDIVPGRLLDNVKRAHFPHTSELLKTGTRYVYETWKALVSELETHNDLVTNQIVNSIQARYCPEFFHHASTKRRQKYR